MIGKFKVAALIGAAVAFVGHWVLHFAVAGALFAAIGLSGGGHDHSAASNGGQHGDCSGYTVSIAGTEDLVTFTADGVVDGVCIKSGGNHSPLFANDGVIHSADGEQKCYLIEGVGTSVVTVTRLGDGDCQEIGHIDVRVNPVTPSPTPPSDTLTPTPTPTVVPSPTPMPPLNPTPTPVGIVTPVGTSISQGSVGFPSTGGAPAVECDDGDARHTKIALAVVLGVGATMAIVFIASYLRR